MADADAHPPPPGGDAASSPIASISPSYSAAAAAAAAIEEQLAGLGLTVAGGEAAFEPSGWDDGPIPVVAGDDEVVPGEKVQAAVATSPAADARVRFPRRPGEPDCSYYVKFGTCRFGTKCKFNHPARKKKSRVKGSGGSGSGSGSNSSSNKASSPKGDQAPKEEYEGLAPDISDSSGRQKKEKNDAFENPEPNEQTTATVPKLPGGHGKASPVATALSTPAPPARMWTESPLLCYLKKQAAVIANNFWSLDRKGFDDKGSASNSIQGADDKGFEYTSENYRKTSNEIAAEPENESYSKKSDETNVTKHKIPKGAKDKRRETVAEGSTLEECKYYATPGGCKFGKACKNLHREGKEGKPEAEKIDLNFLGLPLRPGEKECLFYMRTGSCKYSINCKFHHPDPSNVSSKEPVLEHENSDTPQENVQAPSQTSVPIWPNQRSMNDQHVPFVAPAQQYNAGMMPPQGVYPSPDWSGYHQVPLNPYYPPGVPFQHFPPHLNHQMYSTADIPGHQQVPTEDYPERPGQPECQHFLRSGFCKYKMKCRYHHPRSRLHVPPITGLSPLGLPIKPDQPVCTYYGRFGVCKYGPACMFNHPFNFGAPVHAAGPPIPGQYPTPANFTV